MRFKMHYTINGQEKTYEITASTIEKVREINREEMKKRGIDIDKNDIWSENLAPSPITNY